MSSGAHAACLVSLLHPDRDPSGQGLPAKQREHHGCLSFLSVGTTTFQGVLSVSSCDPWRPGTVQAFSGLWRRRDLAF